jgi:hypothetical protein
LPILATIVGGFSAGVTSAGFRGAGLGAGGLPELTRGACAFAKQKVQNNIVDSPIKVRVSLLKDNFIIIVFLNH